MAFCKNCGAEIEDGAKFCPKCGSAVDGPVNQAAPETNTQAPNTENVSNVSEGSNDKLFAILAYFGFLVIIPIIAAPNSTFVRFHANQGLVLFITMLLCGAIGVIPILGWLITFAGTIFCFVCAIMGIVNAINNEMKELPLIGSIKLLK